MPLETLRTGFGLVRAALFIRALLLSALWLGGGSAALAAVPGVGEISNQATVSFGSDTVQETPTNVVTVGRTVTPPPPPPPPSPVVCTLLLTPGGSVDAPAQSVSGAPGETVLLPYTLTQTGAGGVVNLELVVLTGVFATDATLFLDLNGDGTLGEGEGEITSLELAANASVNLLVQATLGEPAPSDVILELIARCEGEPGNLSRSVSLVTVETIPPPPSLLPILTKDADPPSGSAVVTGQELRYTLSFTAGSQTLTDLVVSDTLSNALGDPALVTDGTVTDPGTGLETTAAATYDPATRELMWTFADEVPATMTVALSFSVTVAPDANGVVTNQAELTTGGMTSLSSAVTHTVSADAPTPPPSPEPC